MINRRSFISGIAAALAAPAIVKAEVLMPVRTTLRPYPEISYPGWLPCDGRLISRSFYAELFAALDVMGKSFGEFTELPAFNDGVMVKASHTPNNKLVPVGTLIGVPFEKFTGEDYHTNIVDYDPS